MVKHNNPKVTAWLPRTVMTIGWFYIYFICFKYYNWLASFMPGTDKDDDALLKLAGNFSSVVCYIGYFTYFTNYCKAHFYYTFNRILIIDLFDRTKTKPIIFVTSCGTVFSAKDLNDCVSYTYIHVVK